MGEVSLTDTYDQHCTYSKETKLWKHSNQYYMLSYAKTRSDQHSLGTSLRIFSRNETRMKAAWVGLSLVYKGANFLIIPPPLIIRNTPRILLCRHCLLPVSLLQVTPPMILYSQVCHILKVKCYVWQGLIRTQLNTARLRGRISLSALQWRGLPRGWVVETHIQD